MQTPLQISFRNMEPSAAIEEEVRARAAKLEEVCHRITSARVVVERPHRQHRHGTLFHVRVDLHVPGHEVVVSREPAEHHEHEDVYVAIRDAFDAARRLLEKAESVCLVTNSLALRPTLAAEVVAEA